MHENILLRSRIISSIRRRMEAAGLRRVPDADPDRELARGCARLPGALAPASRQVLRPAAGAAAVQAAVHDVGLRSLLPDRALLSRRGRARRPLARRVLPARPRDGVRRAGGRVRRGRAGDARPVHGVLRLGRDAAAVPAHPVPRCDRQVRHRQAGPAQPDRDRRRQRDLCRRRFCRVRQGGRRWRRGARGAGASAPSAGRAASSTRWSPMPRAWARPGSATSSMAMASPRDRSPSSSMPSAWLASRRPPALPTAMRSSSSAPGRGRPSGCPG